VLAHLTIPDNGPTVFGVDRMSMHGKTPMEELNELLQVGCLI
jgi:hypothetical protein